MTNKPVCAAIVGLGWWGRRIFDSIHGLSKKITITRVIDLRAETLEEIAAGKNLGVSSRLEDALEDKTVQAMILATPHSLHEKQIILCAAAGKHVFVEKPLALSAEGAERAIRACEAAEVTLGVGHMRRFEPAIQEIKRLIEASELGTIMHVEANFSHDILSGIASDNWRNSNNESPIPVLSSMGIHLTDIFIHLFGPIKEVFAQSTSRLGARVSGDVISVQLIFESGLTAYLNAIMSTPLFVRFHVFGSKAWVETRSDTHPGQDGITELKVSTSDKPVRAKEFQNIDTVRANLEAFADEITSQGHYPFLREEKIENIAVMEAIIDSATRNTPVLVQHIGNWP